MRVWSVGGVILTGIKRRNMSQCHSLHHKSHMESPDIYCATHETEYRDICMTYLALRHYRQRTHSQIVLSRMRVSVQSRCFNNFCSETIKNKRRSSWKVSDILCRILTKLECARHISIKVSNTKFHTNLSSWKRTDKGGKMDRHDEANTRFSLLCKRP